MRKEAIKFYLKIVLSLFIGFLVAYPAYLYGRHFLIK